MVVQVQSLRGYNVKVFQHNSTLSSDKATSNENSKQFTCSNWKNVGQEGHPCQTHQAVLQREEETMVYMLEMQKGIIHHMKSTASWGHMHKMQEILATVGDNATVHVCFVSMQLK